MIELHLHPGEKIMLEVRRHWYLILIQTVSLLILSIAPIVVAANFIEFLPEASLALFIFFSSLWLLIFWLAFFIVWTNYYLDVWIVTDQRIIDIEQYHLFSRDVSEFRLDRIQDITVEVHGLLPTLLKFGNLRVQTAGESSMQFVLRHCPHPYQIKDAILKLTFQNKKNPA